MKKFLVSNIHSIVRVFPLWKWCCGPTIRHLGLRARFFIRPSTVNLAVCLKFLWETISVTTTITSISGIASNLSFNNLSFSVTWIRNHEPTNSSQWSLYFNRLTEFEFICSTFVNYGNRNVLNKRVLVWYEEISVFTNLHTHKCTYEFVKLFIVCAVNHISIFINSQVYFYFRCYLSVKVISNLH